MFMGFTFEICFFFHSFLRTSFLPFVLTTGTLDAARSIETQIVPRRIQYKTQLPSLYHDLVMDHDHVIRDVKDWPKLKKNHTVHRPI